MSDLPALPSGYQLEPIAPPDGAPALPPGFQMEGQSAAPTWADSGTDAAQTVLPSLARGVTSIPGAPGDIGAGIGKVSDWLAAKLGEDPAKIAADRATFNASPLNVLPTSQSIDDATGVSNLHQPTTGLGKLTAAIGQGVPGALAGGVSSIPEALGNVARYAVAPGAISDGASALADYGGLPAWAQKAIGAASGLATAAFGHRVVTPLPASAARVANSEVLDNAGVTQTAGDRTGSPGLNVWEDTLDPTRHDAQSGQFTNAALKVAGVPNPDGLVHGTSGTVESLLDSTSTKYNGVTSRNTFLPDPQLITDLDATRAKYTGTPGLYSDETVNAVNGAQARIAKVVRAGGGQMSGADYQTLRSDLRGAAMNASGDKADALHDIVNSLDDGMERSIQVVNPADAGAFADARDSYKRALVIKKAATMAGPGIAQGNISPAQLGSASQSIYGSRYGAANPFAPLAQAGNANIRTVPTSMTSERQRVNDYIRSAATLGGAAVGAKTGGATEAAVLGLLAGNEIAQPLVRGAARVGLMSGPVQGYLGNQVAARAPGLFSSPQGQIAALRQFPGLLSAPQAGPLRITVHPGLLSPEQP